MPFPKLSSFDFGDDDDAVEQLAVQNDRLVKVGRLIDCSSSPAKANALNLLVTMIIISMLTMMIMIMVTIIDLLIVPSPDVILGDHIAT